MPIAPTETRRKTRPAEPRARKALTRNRPIPGHRVGEVGLVGPLELLPEVGALAEDLAHHGLGVAAPGARGLELAQAAVDPDARRRAGLAVQVGSTELDERLQEGLDGLWSGRVDDHLGQNSESSAPSASEVDVRGLHVGGFDS